MEKTSFDLKTHIHFLLENAMPSENLNNYTIEMVGSTEKGDGYLGDIYFVNLIPKEPNLQKHNLVLKCGKISKALRSSIPVKEAFENEIYLYDVVFPAFKKFQLERGVKDIFDNYPKCYGTFSSPDIEILVLENLKSDGYDILNKRKPMPRIYIETVLKKYGQWHAISAAMKDQEPATYEKIISLSINDCWRGFCEQTDFSKFYLDTIDETLQLFQNDLDEKSYKELKRFRDEIDDIVQNIRRYDVSLRVIIHGDCWNSNFMFKQTDSGALQVNIIDWQLGVIASPIIDLSYFLYCCSSEADIQDLDNLLNVYYQSFSEHLRNLGSDPEKIYPFLKLCEDWKIIARFGIMMSPCIARLVLAEKDDIPDLAKGAESGGAFSETFSPTIKNHDAFKARVLPIIKHVIERGFIKPLNSTILKK